MKTNESITDVFTCFTNIMNGLKEYGKTQSLGEQNRKILDALPKSWQLKTLAIEESKYLKTMVVAKLMRSLLTHEMKLKRFEENENNEHMKKGYALKANDGFSNGFFVD